MSGYHKAIYSVDSPYKSFSLSRTVWGFVFLSPLLFIVWQSIPGSFEEVTKIVSVLDAVALKRFANSFLLGVCATVFSVLLAFPVYLFHLYLPVKFRSFLFITSLIPLSYPPFAVASAWMMLAFRIEQGSTGRILWGAHGWLSQWLYSIPGCAVVLALCYWSVVYLFLTLSTGLTKGHVETGQIYLSPVQRFKRIYFPAWKTPLVHASLLVFVLTMKQFEVPSLLQVNSYPLEIYTRFASLMQQGEAMALCLAYLFLLTGLTWYVRRFRLKGFFSTSHDEPVTLPEVSTGRVCMILAFFVLLLSALTPLFTLFSQSGGIAMILSVISEQTNALFNSLLYSLLSALCIVGAGFWLMKDLRDPVILPIVLLFLFIIPAVIVGAGCLELRSWIPGALPAPLAVTSLVFAFLCHFGIVGLYTGERVWQSYGRKQQEYDTLLTMSLYRRFRFLYLPGMYNTIGKAVGFAALLVWGDVGMTILLHPPGGSTLTVEYFNLLHYGAENRTAGIGLLLTGTPFVLLVSVNLICGLRKQRY